MSIDEKPEIRIDEANGGKSQTNQRSQPKVLTSTTAFGSISEEGGLDLGQVLEVIQRRLWIILGMTTIIMGVTIVWNRTRPPAYDGSFQVLIEPATVESQVVSSLGEKGAGVQDQEAGASGNSSTTLDYPTQIQILRSPKLLNPIVD